MSWISKQEEKLMKDFFNKQERYIMGIDPISERQPNPNESKKWAWIEINGKREMAWVDNVTMKAYKADGYDMTDIEIPKYKFERWCRPMDL